MHNILQQSNIFVFGSIRNVFFTKNEQVAAQCCTNAAQWPNCSILPKSGYSSQICMKLCMKVQLEVRTLKKNNKKNCCSTCSILLHTCKNAAYHIINGVFVMHNLFKWNNIFVFQNIKNGVFIKNNQVAAYCCIYAAQQPDCSILS